MVVNHFVPCVVNCQKFTSSMVKPIPKQIQAYEMCGSGSVHCVCPIIIYAIMQYWVRNRRTWQGHGDGTVYLSNVLTTFTITSHNSAQFEHFPLSFFTSILIFWCLFSLLILSHFTVPVNKTKKSTNKHILPHQNGLHNEKENT